MAYHTLGENMMAALRQIADQDQPAVDRLEAVLRGLFVAPVSDATKTSAWLGFWHASRNNPRLRAINRDIYAEYRAFLTELVEDAARELDSDADASEVTSTLLSLADGAWVALAIDPDVDAPEASTLAYIRLAMGQRDSEKPRRAPLFSNAPSAGGPPRA